MAKKVEPLFGKRGASKKRALLRAQEIVYDAWECGRRKDRLALAHEALSVSEDCAEAYLILAEVEAKTMKRKYEYCQQAFEAAKRTKLKAAYMRSLAAIADVEWELGKTENAISHLEELLQRHPTDDQGNRFTLLSHFLELHDLGRTEALMEKYREEDLPEWRWAKFLVGFLKKEDPEKLKSIATVARDKNELIPDFLLGVCTVDDAEPGEYLAPGTEEAVAYAAVFQKAWESIDGALDYLAENV